MRIAAEGTVTAEGDTFVVDVGGYDRLTITASLSPDAVPDNGQYAYAIIEASLDGANWHPYYLVQSKQGADNYDQGFQQTALFPDYGALGSVAGGVGIYFIEPGGLIALRWIRLRMAESFLSAGQMKFVVTAAVWD